MDIAAQIINHGGDYSLGLKGNQESLHEAVEDYFAVAKAADFKAVKYDYAEEIDKEHGRLETRRHRICEDLITLPKPERWKGLCSIGMVERETIIRGKTTLEQRFFINSFEANAKTFAHAVLPIGALKIAGIGGLMW